MGRDALMGQQGGGLYSIGTGVCTYIETPLCINGRECFVSAANTRTYIKSTLECKRTTGNVNRDLTHK